MGPIPSECPTWAATVAADDELELDRELEYLVEPEEPMARATGEPAGGGE